jgi:glycosyltransferase involved in cell wall biosynthesis
MRVLIATTCAPFVRGGAEVLAEGLRDALIAEGNEAEIVAIPFKGYPPERILDQMIACRMWDLTESAGVPVDCVIGLKFPAYLAPHPRKVFWILHQHRTAYDLWDHPLGDLIYSPYGRLVREAIKRADDAAIRESSAVFTIAGNVSRRLKQYNGIDSETVYNPPPFAEAYHSGPCGGYFFFPSRITPIKRQYLVLEAMALARNPVQVRFAGAADYPPHFTELIEMASRLGLDERAKFLGQVADVDKRELYANSLAVLFPPLDEDYGYVTLEAMLASKAVVTCADSGGPLEFIVPDETGFITEPDPGALAEAMDLLWENRAKAEKAGEAGRAHYESLGITWTNVVRRLLG